MSNRTRRSTRGMKITPHYLPSFYQHADSAWIKSTIIEPVLKEISETLKVRQAFTGTLRFNRECPGGYYPEINYKGQIVRPCDSCARQTTCSHLPVPNKFLKSCYIGDRRGGIKTDQRNQGSGATNTDMVMLFGATRQGCGKTTLAYATSCDLDGQNKQPRLGITNICSMRKGPGVNKMKSTVWHEILHALGFSDNLYKHFRSASGGEQDVSKVVRKVQRTIAYQDASGSVFTTKKTVNAFVLPSVVNVAQQYFGCSSIQAVDIEDRGSGSAGAHFEERLLGTEMMTPMISSVGVFSAFSAALMQSTGWYIVNPNKVGQITYGRGAGCTFAQQGCLLHRKDPYAFDGVVKGKEKRCSAKRDYVEMASFNFFGGIPQNQRYFKDQTKAGTEAADFCPVWNDYFFGDQSLGSDCKDESYNEAIKNSDAITTQSFGSDSFCFETNVFTLHTATQYFTPGYSGAGCFRRSCRGNKVTIIVPGHDQSGRDKEHTFTCSHAGQKLTVDHHRRVRGKGLVVIKGEVICPSYSAVC